MTTMETARLLVRNFRADDWEDLYAYLSQQEVLRYEPEKASDAEDCKKKAFQRSQSNAFWAVCLKDSHKMIGHVYFKQIDPTEFLTWEFGYIFNPKYYGKGYATEACRRILQYGFEELGAHRVIGMCNPENTASWRLMERLAMRREGFHLQKAFFARTVEGKPIWHDAYQYAILKEEWHK
jgi:ribosomal-protein-alanine N-acetyltransferase